MQCFSWNGFCEDDNFFFLIFLPKLLLWHSYACSSGVLFGRWDQAICVPGLNPDVPIVLTIRGGLQDVWAQLCNVIIISAPFL